jgi:hypothetical protein
MALFPHFAPPRLSRNQQTCIEPSAFAQLFRKPRITPQPNLPQHRLDMNQAVCCVLKLFRRCHQATCSQKTCCLLISSALSSSRLRHALGSSLHTS